MEDKKVRLVWITPNAEGTIAYCARVSSSNQTEDNAGKLIKYCAKHGHWSIFEMASMCVEITTSRAIAMQILRHKSFSFQQFSQRYALQQGREPIRLRRQDTKNRQNSIDDIPLYEQVMLQERINAALAQCENVYNELIENGVAKECARMVLPECSTARMYMSGTIRSWIHYLQVRCGNETQLEHRLIAEQIKDIFTEQLPILGELLNGDAKC